MNEGRFYVAGGAVAFAGLSVLVLAGPVWLGGALLGVGVAALALAAWQTRRRTGTVRVEIEDDHLHPIPVLDAPKGTFDLIAGVTVRLDNRSNEPIEVRIDTRLYRRTAWQWDLPVLGARTVPLMTSSVVPPRTAKSFFVKNYTRIPESVAALGPEHFVKLIVDRTGLGKSVHRIFLQSRFELPKASRLEARAPSRGWDEAPLLPFEGEPAAPAPAPKRRPTRLANWLANRRVEGEILVHPLRESDDTLEGLIEEIEAELEEETESGGRG